MRLLPVLTCLCILAGCGESNAPSTEPAPIAAAPVRPAVPEADLFVLAVGGNGFRPGMGLDGLRERYGIEHVSSVAVPLGEGDSEAGAVIYPDDATRRATVYFVDGKVTGPISAIYVRDPESIWRGPLGLKLGTTSLELERINGRPFRFLGFDWDYGGYVSNWTEGMLAHAFLSPGQLALRLAPAPLAEGQQRVDGYPSGDGEFTSDLPAVRAQPPLVVEMGLGFTLEQAAPQTPVQGSAN
jgi:hypothetical protein